MSVRAIAISVVLFFATYSSASADCMSARAVCDDANRAYQNCGLSNASNFGAVCSPLFNAKLSACAQAEYTCSKAIGMTFEFTNDAQKESFLKMQEKADEIIKKSIKATD